MSRLAQGAPPDGHAPRARGRRGHRERASAPAALAIASCGNAALAAAVVARAAGRELDVFIPPDADPAVVARLRELGARAHRLRAPTRRGRRPDLSAGCGTAIAAGAVPFTCQGNQNGLAIEGGATLGYEIADALPATRRARSTACVIQVGGGALAVGRASRASPKRAAWERSTADPRIHPVQTRGASPAGAGVRAARAIGSMRQRADRR